MTVAAVEDSSQYSWQVKVMSENCECFRIIQSVTIPKNADFRHCTKNEVFR